MDGQRRHIWFQFLSAISSETMYATNVALVPGQYVMGAGITTPIQVLGYGSLTPCATSDPNLWHLHYRESGQSRSVPRP